MTRSTTMTRKQSSRFPGSRTPRAACGFTLIEILVSIAILSIGLLGIAGLMVQAQNVEYEAYQRGQALLLVEDMAQRMINNRINADDYVLDDPVPATQTVDGNCIAKATQVEVDICEWEDAMRGAAVDSGGSAAATYLANARGCITAVPGATGVFIVEVVWQGRTATVAPVTACGNTLYSNDATRRSVTLTVRVPDLS